MVVGPAGLHGHHALEVEGQEAVHVLIPLHGTEDKIVSEKPLKHLTVKSKICNI